MYNIYTGVLKLSCRIIIIIWIALFIVLSLISINIGLHAPIWTLNENQILYLCSTSAQVLSGIYGLTLMGFIFFRGDIIKSMYNDESLKEILDMLSKRYFYLFIFVTFMSLVTIAICNLTITVAKDDYTTLKIILMNTAQVSLFISLISSAYLVFDIIMPNRIEKASEKLRKLLDISKKAGDVLKFIENFNFIDAELQKYGTKIKPKDNNSLSKYQNRIPNKKILEILLHSNIINNTQFDRIKNLIELRNTIVHGFAPTVSFEMVKLSGEIRSELSELLNHHST